MRMVTLVCVFVADISATAAASPPGDRLARARKDFYERKFIKLVGKIVGVKTATSLFTCSATLPRNTNPFVRSLAKLVCG